MLLVCRMSRRTEEPKNRRTEERPLIQVKDALLFRVWISISCRFDLQAEAHLVTCLKAGWVEDWTAGQSLPHQVESKQMLFHILKPMSDVYLDRE